MIQDSPAIRSEQSSTIDETCTNGSLELVDEHKKNEHQEAHEVAMPTQAEGHEAFQVCRVCQCADPDKAGELALKSLGICFPLHATHQRTTGDDHISIGETDKVILDVAQGNTTAPNCESDVEAGACLNDSLIELGCACRSDLALAHYACALRWFVSRDSIICEICGRPALNVRSTDRDKVISTLKEKYLLLQSTVGGANSSQSCTTDLVTALASSMHGRVAFDSVSWFDPHGSLVSDMSRNASDPVVNVLEEGRHHNSVSPATKWAVEGTGILIATGLLTVTITWLLAPRVNKGVARRGLNVLLAGLCALAIVVFLRFGVLPRIKYGPARYWAILVVFWFLIFGVWASSTRNARTNT